jgi:hypothetical protein
MANNWIVFEDGIEVEQPNEKEMIEEIVASMARVNRKVFDQHRHALRDAHAKSHGVLKGTLRIYPELPEDLAQGIFQPGREYAVVARLSSAPGNIHADKIRSLKGLALKVIGVEGAKVLPGREHDATQDFLLVNLPILPFGDVKSYLDFQRKSEEREERKESPATLIPELASTASSALKAAGLPPNRTLEAVGATAHHILGETFHSMAAIRFGRYIAKLSAAPLSLSVTSLTGREVDSGENDSLYRDLVVDFFRTQTAEYEMRAQMCADLSRMPVEDASVEWPAQLSPHLPLGKLTFPPQNAYSPARRVFADDVLSFNPWHCIEDHRPLGSIMRSRIRAYEASSAFRHGMNAQPQIEPRDIVEIPD